MFPDKVVDTPEAAVADVPDGSSIAVGGFGVLQSFPLSVIRALREQGATGLQIVCNSLGAPGGGRTHSLVENGQVDRLITSFSERPGVVADPRIADGSIAVELVGQGTLVERLRAGGAGIAAFYTKTGAGTAVAAGKEVRYFDGEAYLLEHALRVDYAFIRARRADRLGNLEFRGSSRHFNVSFAKAATVAIAEVDEIVDVGEIDPERVGLPGAFVSRVVRAGELPSGPPAPVSDRSERRRTYLGRPALSRREMAEVAARLLPAGGVVNLGVGLPTLISEYAAGSGIVLHAENGVLGYGRLAGESPDLDVYNAGGQFVELAKGASFFDSVTSFEIARSGRLDTAVLGAYQVDSQGSFANWKTPEMSGGGIGGAMDLVAGGASVMVLMEHRDRNDRSKLVRHCSYELTGTACVDIVVTDLAVLVRRDGGFVLEGIARGFSPRDIAELTDLELRIASEPVVLNP